ncbi:MAG: molybdopterin-guanine dinucleotide biosynthesis protein B [Tepidanaerobacteraceae bacterium]|jgi:molybdopterin-guanine dinucleotide biosynthesis protein B|nr:molybdopterin-guanine dinucleotide biosynthesis protein B [Thermoanaerobacterales bacterium]
MKVFSVVGVTKSGKTTTIEQIIKEFIRRGYSVGSVKEIHFEQFAIDKSGTNTDRHRKAGSQPVTARGLNETDILFSKQLSVDEILKFYNHDFVVLEGVTDFNVPKIVCAHNKQEIDERLVPTVFALSGIIAEKLNQYKGLPVFNALNSIKELVDYIEDKVPHVLPNVPKECCGKCGTSCEEMLIDIINGKRKRSECVIDKGDVKLFIGDEEIKMVPFVKDVLAGTVKGFLSNLKGYEKDKEITIKIYPEKD